MKFEQFKRYIYRNADDPGKVIVKTLSNISFIICISAMVVGCEPAKLSDETIFICVPAGQTTTDFIAVMNNFAAANEFKLVDDGVNKLAESKSIGGIAQENRAPEGPPVFLALKSKKSKRYLLLASNFSEPKNVVRASFFYYEEDNLGVEIANHLKSKLRHQGFTISGQSSGC